MPKTINDNRGRSSVKFKVNQIENSKRLLNTSKLQFKFLWKYKEFGWMIKYLENLGYEEKDIYLQWKKCYILNYGDCFEEEDLEKEYSKIKQKITKKIDVLFSGEEIVFYEEEIEIINSIVCPKWIKEYFIILLGYFKFIGSADKYVSLGSIPRNTLLVYFTSKKRQGDYETQAIYDFARKNNLIDISDDGKILLKFVKFAGKEVLRLKTSADLKEACAFIKNIKKCSCCGKEFEYNSHCQRDLCLECWKIKDKSKRNKIMRDRYYSDKPLLLLI